MPEMTQTAQIEGQVTISAPAEKIFAILSNLETFAKLVPGVTPTVRDGDAILVDYAVRPLGINLPIVFRAIRVSIVDSLEPAALTFGTDGLIKSTIPCNLQPRGNDTIVAVKVTYQMDTGAINSALSALGGVVGGVISTVRQVISPLLSANSSTLQQFLGNLKKVSESQN